MLPKFETTATGLWQRGKKLMRPRPYLEVSAGLDVSWVRAQIFDKLYSGTFFEDISPHLNVLERWSNVPAEI